MRDMLGKAHLSLGGSVFTREDINSLPVPDAKFQEAVPTV